MEAKLQSLEKPSQKPPTTLARAGIQQRKCDGYLEEDKLLQRSAVSSVPEAMRPKAQVTRSPGASDADTRAFRASRFGTDFSHVPVHSRSPVIIQAKLTINAPGDVYEQEADRIADQVLITPTHQVVGGKPMNIQRFAGQPAGQIGSVPASVDRAIASPGRPLEPVLRRDMEQRFGHDFSGVRVHTGLKAVESALELNAQAFTTGHHVIFGGGRYTPETTSGKTLLVHELTHVVQQSKQVASGKLIQRKPEICEVLPDSCVGGTPEIVAVPPSDNYINVGQEKNALLSAVEFDMRLNNPVDYRWSVKLDPRNTIQITGLENHPPYKAVVVLKGLKQGQATIFPLLEIRQRNRKTIHVEGNPFTVTVIPVVLTEATSEYRKYLADYERYTIKQTELKLKESKGEKVGEKIQEENVEEIKRHERAKQKGEEAAKIALDVSKKNKVHDPIGSLLSDIDREIDKIENAKAAGYDRAIGQLTAEELETPSNANAFWIALAGNLLWALSGSLPYFAASVLARMKLPKLKNYFQGSSIAATNTATLIGTIGAMTAQFSAGLPAGGKRKAGLKKELLKYFGIINTAVADKQHKMSRLLLLETMSKEPPTEKMDPIDYVADLSVGLRYSLYGDIFEKELNLGDSPHGEKITEYAKEQLLHQYVAGSSAISGGKIEPTAITKLEGENLVEQAIKALGGEKALLFGPYELVKNQLHKVAIDIGASIDERYIDALITDLMSGRDSYVPVTAPKRDALVNLMDAGIMCVNTGGVSGYCSYPQVTRYHHDPRKQLKEEADSLIAEGLFKRIWIVNKVMNKLEMEIEEKGKKERRTMYSVKRFFFENNSSTPTEEFNHIIYKVTKEDQE